jgi:pimeloyl-ACP methyl ester carboxylesterase
MEIGGVTFVEETVSSRDGTRLCVLVAGEEAGSPILCLHGFPDPPHTFRYQFKILIESGFRLVVPFLRGYPPSQTGKNDYYGTRLLEDAETILDRYAGERKSVLLGHDWGALVGYSVATFCPERLEKLVTVAVPPFPAFENTGASLGQFWSSRYMLFFQLGPIANWCMRRKHLAGLDYLWSYWSPDWKYTEEDIAPLKACLGQPGAMEAATGYYRAMLWRSIRDQSFVEVMRQPLKVPTLMVGGLNDGCISPDYYKDLTGCFESGWLLASIENAGHFVHCEKPDEFNQHLMEFLSA